MDYKKQVAALSCYFCGRERPFVATVFMHGFLPEVACSDCKHLIKEVKNVSDYNETK